MLLHACLQYSETSYCFDIQYKMANFKFFVVVKCDYIEALHIEMHVHTSNLNPAFIHDDLDMFFHGKLQ